MLGGSKNLAEGEYQLFRAEAAKVMSLRNYTALHFDML